MHVPVVPNVEIHVYALRVHADQYRRIRNACDDDVCMDVNVVRHGCRVGFANGYPCSTVVITLAVRQDIAAALTFECWPVAVRAIRPVCHDRARAWLGLLHERHSGMLFEYAGAVAFTESPNAIAAITLKRRGGTRRASCPYVELRARAFLRRRVRGWLVNVLARRAAWIIWNVAWRARAMQLYPKLNVELVRVIVAVKAEHLATYTRCDGHTVRESASVAYIDLIKHALVASWRPAAWCTS